MRSLGRLSYVTFVISLAMRSSTTCSISHRSARHPTTPRIQHNQRGVINKSSSSRCQAGSTSVLIEYRIMMQLCQINFLTQHISWPCHYIRGNLCQVIQYSGCNYTRHTKRLSLHKSMYNDYHSWSWYSWIQNSGISPVWLSYGLHIASAII